LTADSGNLKLAQLAAVFFDFGDTLVGLSPTREELFTRAASAIGLTLDIAAVRLAYFTVDFHTKYSSVTVKDQDAFYRDYNAQLCAALGISSHLAKLQPALAVAFKNDKRWKLMDDAPGVLGRLRARNVPLALVANWDANLPALVERLGINSHFSAIVPSQAVGVEKPSPAIFQIALERLSLSVETQTILYVGNEYRADVLGARAAGLTPVLIDRNHFYPNADCRRFTSLAEWLKAME
jgi:putative hydrolase of the HAD superfamily